MDKESRDVYALAEKIGNEFNSLLRILGRDGWPDRPESWGPVISKLMKLRGLLIEQRAARAEWDRTMAPVA